MCQVDIVKRVIAANERWMRLVSSRIYDLEKTNDPALSDDIKDLYNELRTYEEWDTAYRHLAKELCLL